MDGGARVERRRSFKERLGLKGISCCGPTWGFNFRPSTMSDRDGDDHDNDDGEFPHLDQHLLEATDVGQTPPASTAEHGCEGRAPSVSGMNLATALAAERHLRAALDSSGGGGRGSPVVAANEGVVPGPPLRVSLMRLLEETDGGDGEREAKETEEGGAMGCDSVCCVCMGRGKGAAFIPCGHTFCRVCSRELWLNRGSCPLCNRPILEILDIF